MGTVAAAIGETAALVGKVAATGKWVRVMQGPDDRLLLRQTSKERGVVEEVGSPVKVNQAVGGLRLPRCFIRASDT